MGDPAQALELLQEALAILHQTCGPLHPQTANCYKTLAIVSYQLADLQGAISFQQKAVGIMEIVAGVYSVSLHKDFVHVFGLEYVVHSHGDSRRWDIVSLLL
jgi:hypothetical protein